jgi:hypothetical protein
MKYLATTMFISAALIALAATSASAEIAAQLRRRAGRAMSAFMPSSGCRTL